MDGGGTTVPALGLWDGPFSWQLLAHLVEVAFVSPPPAVIVRGAGRPQQTEGPGAARIRGIQGHGAAGALTLPH